MNRAWRYHGVAATFWNDPKVRAWDEDARTLALYLLTNPARSPEGFYHLSTAMACDDLTWPPDRYEKARGELTATDFADFDDDARVVLIVKGLKYHKALRGEKVLKGALNALIDTNGSPRLFARFMDAAERYQPDFAAAIRAFYGIAG